MSNALHSDLHRVLSVSERRNDRADMRSAPRSFGKSLLAPCGDVEHADDRRHMGSGTERCRDRLGRSAQEHVSGVDVEIENVFDIRRHATSGEPCDVLQFVLQPRKVVQIPERGRSVAACLKIHCPYCRAARSEVDPRVANLNASRWVATMENE